MDGNFGQSITATISAYQALSQKAGQVATGLDALQRHAKKAGGVIQQADIAAVAQAHDETAIASDAAQIKIVALANTYFE